MRLNELSEFMERYSIDVNRLVSDIIGLVAQLKTIYFENKDPIDDNEVILQKLCVKVETALRHGMKDKYSFLGVRKDYWNFFSECLSKDEGVRYVNSLSQLHTVQGKGRALIRYCLVQKTLADTIQRSLMHKRKEEWFSSEALLLNKSLSGALIGKLYDLNELEFHLSCTGCDLDMSWPAFGRSFSDGFERRSRRTSVGSVASTTDFANERVDPLIALNTELSALKQMVSREFDREKSVDDGVGESSNSSNVDLEIELNISDVTLELSRVHQFILKWKSAIDAKMYKAEGEIERLAEKKDRITRESNLQLVQLAEKHENLSTLASKESALLVTELQNKLSTAETVASQHKQELDSLDCKLHDLLLNYDACKKNLTDITQQLTLSRSEQENNEKEIYKLKEALTARESENTTVENELYDMKAKMKHLQTSELSLKKALEESKAKLDIKTLEQEKLREAFENVNGLVFSSFDDFESYDKMQLLDKHKGLETKQLENKSLERRVKLITDEKKHLKKELGEAPEKLASTQGELEENAEKQHGQQEECSALRSQVQTLKETMENTSKVLSEYYSCRWHERNDKEMCSSTEPESSVEEQCRALVNDLKEAEQQLKVCNEALENAAREKTAVEAGSETLSLEVDRFLKENEVLRKENIQLCTDREEEKSSLTALSDRVRALEQERSELENTVSSERGEKANLEAELKAISDKLQEESLQRIVNENEVSDIGDQLNRVTDEKVKLLEEIEELKMDVTDTKRELGDKEAEIMKYKDELSSTRTMYDATSDDLQKIQEEMKLLIEEKSGCEDKLSQYEQQLASLQCTMDQEVSSLRFQLSSQALKYDGEIKELSSEKEEAIALRDKIQENEETIAELENKLKERNETWQAEKKKLTGDLKQLKYDIKVLNDNIECDKREIQSMESTLILSKKQYEKEKGRNKEYRKTIKEIKNQKSERENRLECEKTELEEDVRQLKAKLVSLLSDKSELWKRSNQLQFDMKTRLSETWVEDKDVTRCAECKVEFTLFLRKHHCRFCGNVFCFACSDNFVKTIHSRKPYRCCNVCFKKEKDLKSGSSFANMSTDRQDRPDNSLSISSQGSDSDLEYGFGQSPTGPLKRTSTPVTDRRMTTDSETQRAEDIGNNLEAQIDQAQFDDTGEDSDENYEIIEDECEDSLSSLLLQDNLNVEAEIFTPIDNRDSQVWSEATIPAEKRYIIPANVLPGSHVIIEFISFPQGVLFGAVVKEHGNTGEIQTVIPMCQINSHERCAKKQLRVTCSGIAMFVFDNIHLKSTENKIRFKIFTQTPAVGSK